MSLKDEYEELKNRPTLIVEQDHDPEDDSKPVVETVEGFNILVLTSSTDSKMRKMSKKNPTIIKMEEHCKTLGIPFYTAFADTAYIEKYTNGNIKIFNVGDEEGYEIDRDKTIIFARRGVLFHRYSLNLMTALERYRFCFLNEKVGIETCEDKNLTILRLIDAGLPVPLTALVPTEELIEKAHEKVGGEFPVVVKILNGTQGRGVFIANDEKSLKSTLQAMWAIGSSCEMLMQKFIVSKFDVRIHVLGDKVIGAMKRNVIDGDFRSNVHLGGQTGKYKPTKEIQELAIKAAKAVKCKWVGVDIMFDKQNNPYILEVNASPGTDGIEELTGDDIVQKVIDFMSDGNNWTRPPQEVGVLEVINVEGIGELVSRFDTGNGSNSISIDAQDINVDGGDISWTTNGVKMTSKKVGRVSIKSGKSDTADDRDERERPMVYMDVTFEGVLYKDVLFNLNDRSHKSTPVLINKDFMIRSGSVINPSRIFNVTSRPKGFKIKSVKNNLKFIIKDDGEEN